MSIDHGDEVRELTARAETAERALAEAREAIARVRAMDWYGGSKAGSCTGTTIHLKGTVEAALASPDAGKGSR